MDVVFLHAHRTQNIGDSNPKETNDWWERYEGLISGHNLRISIDLVKNELEYTHFQTRKHTLSCLTWTNVDELMGHNKGFFGGFQKLGGTPKSHEVLGR